MKPLALLTYQGPAGDHNDLARAGARAIGDSLASRLGVGVALVGKPGPVLNAAWDIELDAARESLRHLSTTLDAALTAGATPVCALTRCAAALATLPVVVAHRRDACIVWFDAHADLNTPDTSPSGYLGGMAIAGAAGLWNSGFGSGLALDRVVLVGTRDVDPAEQARIDTSRLALVPAAEGVGEAVRRAVAGRPVYVHVDCDVLDAGILPTDYAVAGGLTLAQLREACAVLAEVELIGLEIAEFQQTRGEEGPVVSTAPLIDALAPLLEQFRAR